MQERIDLMDLFVRLFGSRTIECLLSDWEFVGDKWLEYLNKLHSEYHMRIRENYWFEKPSNGRRIETLWLFNNLRINDCAFYHKIVWVNGELCYRSASRIINNQNVPELHSIV